MAGEKIGTVLIPCLNAAPSLSRVLAALASQSIRDRLDIVVVDNGSSDESVEIARAAADRVAVATKPGAYEARNLGLSFVSTRFLLTLDADCEPIDGDWAARHIAALEGAASNVFGSAGTILAAPTGDWWANRAEITPHPAFAEGRPLYANGGNACLWTGWVRRLGGFPPYGADDAALGRLAAKRGLTYVFTPDAAVYHRNPEGWRGYYRQMEKIGTYVGEAYEPPDDFVRFTAATAKRMVSNARHLLRGDVREALAGCLRVAGQSRGALKAWRRAVADGPSRQPG
jgi:poly-beta-1,6-N-acetyl-D-glucosamine synthase